jgi:hypothetical protein
MAPKPVAEGRRLIEQLFSLRMSTLIVAAGSDRLAPDMAAMLHDLHVSYGGVTGQSPDARFDQIAASLRSRAAELTEGRRRLQRLSRSGDALHEIVARAGGGGGVVVDQRRLSPDDAATITRAWELALDPIHVSTTVWLDEGDVITQVATAGAGPPEDTIITFHSDMVENGTRTWESLLRLVTQFVTTIVSMALRRLRGSPSLARVRPAAGSPRPASRPLPAARVPARARALFGTGGVLFVTDAPDGTPGGIRTLVQITGDIVTRATADAIADPATLAEHQAKIDAWFAHLATDWRHARALLATAAAGGTAVLLATDVTALAHASGWHIALLALPLAPPVIARVLRNAARRFFLHATKGPAALLPARS